MSSKPNGVYLRFDHDELHRIDTIAERMGITRTELVRKATLNGIDDLGRCVALAEWPIFQGALRLVAKFGDDPEAANHLEQILNAISETKATRRQGSLPGMEPA